MRAGAASATWTGQQLQPAAPASITGTRWASAAAGCAPAALLLRQEQGAHQRQAFEWQRQWLSQGRRWPRGQGAVR